LDFGDAPVRVAIHSSEEAVEIFIEADFETLLEERRRFAILNIPATSSGKPPAQRRDTPQNPVTDAVSRFGYPSSPNHMLAERTDFCRLRIHHVAPLPESTAAQSSNVC